MVTANHYFFRDGFPAKATTIKKLLLREPVAERSNKPAGPKVKLLSL